MTSTVLTVKDFASLNAAILTADAAASGAYVIDITGAINLTTALAEINLASGVSLDIEGQSNTIDGGGTQQGLFVYSGNVSINNLTIADAVAKGADGSSGGGGGAGLGGGLFVGNGGNVTLNNVSFNNDSATGGNGGSFGSGGGGGLHGGFGGGGGAGALGGFGGGNGGSSGGGGGLGAGGDIFVSAGAALTIDGGTAGLGNVNGGTGAGGGQNGLFFGSGIFLQGNETITLGTAELAGQKTIISGVIADEQGSNSLDTNAGSLIIDGAGTVDLTAANTFTGGITLESGTLELAKASSAGLGTIAFAGAPATLELDKAALTKSASTGSSSYSRAITNFALGDTIDLAGFTTSVSPVYSGKTLTLGTDKLTNIGLAPGETINSNGLLLIAKSDGAGGTDVTLAEKPVISGTLAGQVTGYVKPVDPFSGVQISDPNPGATDSAAIVISGAGTLSDGAGFTGLSFSSGTYTVTAQSASALSSEIQALVYTPAASKSVQHIGFTLTDNSSAGTSAADTTTTLTVDPGPTVSTVPQQKLNVGNLIDLTRLLTSSPYATPGISGDTLTITADSIANTYGTVTLTNGDLTYAATTSALSHIYAGQSLADSFGYTISDQYGDTATGTVNISVTNPPAWTINGNQYGDVTIQGTSGSDIINAYNYYNTIYANGGNDVINAGQGDATVYTGTGSVDITLSGSGNTVSGGTGVNADGWDTVTGGSGGSNKVTLGNGNDSVNTGGYGNIITLGNGNDTVNGGLGNDTITVGNGNDSVAVGGNPNKITVGSGTDTITASPNSGAGQFTVVAGVNGVGNDTINLLGQNNNVTLNGSQASVTGAQGSDTFTVNSGTDSLSFSGQTNTVTVGGTSVVSITDLGAGLRLNVASSTQKDTIYDFASDASAVVDLKSGLGLYSSTTAIVNALQSDQAANGFSLSLGTGSIVFENTTKAQLTASHFSIA